ncbi:MAG TPA: cation:proton antiporter, partial [Myxococcaceae bacterium]|nr:cation:proton antiporter [Myxococcaceae bacterium]
MPWATLSFLPRPPLHGNQVLFFGLLLLLGLLGGELAKRLLRLPRIFGYVLAGALVGATGLAMVGESFIQDGRVFVDVALGLLVFDLGRRVDLPWMLREKWLLFSGVTESVLTFALIYLVLRMFGLGGSWSAVAAAIGVATSPPVVMVMVADLRGEGQVTDRVLLHTSINCALASVAVAVLTSAVHAEHGAHWTQVALHPVYLLVGSIALAGVMAWVLLRLARLCGKREDLQFILMAGVVVSTVGLADLLKLPVLLALLCLGALARNLDSARVLRSVELGSAARIFVVVLFVLTGASLRLRSFAGAAVPAVGYILARLAGKALGTILPSRLGGLPLQRGVLVTLALQPLSATAVVLALDAAALYPDDGGQLTAVVLSAVALLELVGPLAVQFAIQRA